MDQLPEADRHNAFSFSPAMRNMDDRVSYISFLGWLNHHLTQSKPGLVKLVRDPGQSQPEMGAAALEILCMVLG